MPTEHPDPFEDRTTANPVERQIREAMERGEFDRLPGSGKPLADLDEGYDPAWWAKRFVARARFEDAVRDMHRTIDRELPLLKADMDRDRAARRVAEINAMITAVNDRLPEAEAIPPLELPE